MSKQISYNVCTYEVTIMVTQAESTQQEIRKGCA